MFIGSESNKLLVDPGPATKRVNTSHHRGLHICFAILLVLTTVSVALVLLLDFAHNIKVAIGITTFAGCAALIGGTSIFCVNNTMLGVIPMGLSFSAGVIIYLCLLGLIPESINEFEHAVNDEGLAHLYCTLCVVSGIIITVSMEFAFSKFGIDVHNHELAQFEMTSVSYTESNVNTKHNEDSGGFSAFELSHLSYSVAVALILHHFPEGIATFVALYYDLKFGALIAFALAVHDIPAGICIAMPVYLATDSVFLPMFLCFLAAITYPIGAFVGWAVIENTSDEFIEVLNGILFGMTGGIMLYITFVELLPKASLTASHYRKQQHSSAVNMVTVSYLLFFIGFLVMDTSNIIIKFTDAGHH